MGVLMNEDRFYAVSVLIDVASVAANTSAEQDFTVPGLVVGDIVTVVKPSLSAGLVIGNVRVKAANTLSITFGNLTASPINPAAETYLLKVFHPEKTYTNNVPL